MARVVAVHGAGYQYQGANVLSAMWGPAIRDGLARAGYSAAEEFDVAFAFYGDLFLPIDGRRRRRIQPTVKTPNADDVARMGLRGARQLPPRAAANMSNNSTQDFLLAWHSHAAEVEQVTSNRSVSTKRSRGDFANRLRVGLALPRVIEVSLSRLFWAIGERALAGNARQFSMYVKDQELRTMARERIAASIEEDTQVVVGHSLGGLVAYEALCLHPELSVTTFVTMGSPLGMRGLIFDRLDPAPEEGVGKWPEGIVDWHNIVDLQDFIALGKQLSPLFGGRVQDHVVDNGKRPHDLDRYLSQRETGHAIAGGLGWSRPPFV